MKPTVFGPTGPTGDQIGRQALAADYEVTAVAPPTRGCACLPAAYRTRHPCAMVVGNIAEPGLNEQEPYVV